MPGGILALDLATSTGWAHAGAEVLAAWPASPLEAAAAPAPAFDLGTKVFPGTAARLGRFADAFHEWLAGRIGLFDPRLVVFEAQYVGPNTSKAMARKLFGLAWHAEWLCDRLGVPCEEAEPGDVRGHFTGIRGGKRPAVKARVMAACQARGWAFANDDEADALSILDYAVACRWAGMRAERLANIPDDVHAWRFV